MLTEVFLISCSGCKTVKASVSVNANYRPDLQVCKANLL